MPDNTPAYEMQRRRAESMMRGLVREEFISQLSHTGYLGVELAKAENSLRLDLSYEQDHPLNKR
jgi:dihydropteroate synthase